MVLKSKKKLILIILIISLLIIISLAGLIYFKFYRHKKLNNQSISKVLEYKEEKLSKVDSSKDYVYTQYTSKEQLLDKGYTEDVEIPVINLTGEYATKINSSISSLKDEASKELDKNSILNINYEWNYTDDILFLSIHEQSGMMNSETTDNYYMYAINCQTGQPFSITEACDKFNIDVNDISYELADDKVQDKIDVTNSKDLKGYYIDSMGQMEVFYNKKYYDVDEDTKERTLSLEGNALAIVKAKATYTTDELDKYNSIYYGYLQDELGKDIKLIGSDIKIIKELSNNKFLCNEGNTAFILDKEDYDKIMAYAWNKTDKDIALKYSIVGSLNRVSVMTWDLSEQTEDTINNKIDNSQNAYNSTNILYIKNAKLTYSDVKNKKDYSVKEDDSIYYTFSKDLSAVEEAQNLINKNPFLYDKIKSVDVEASNFKVNKSDGKYGSVTLESKEYSETFYLADGQIGEFTKLNAIQNGVYNGTAIFTIKIFSNTGYFINDIKETSGQTYNPIDIYNNSPSEEPLKTYISEHIGIYNKNNANYMEEFTLIAPYIIKKDDLYYLDDNKYYDLNLIRTTPSGVSPVISESEFEKISGDLSDSDREGYKVYNGIVTLYNNGGNFIISKYKSFN